MSAEHLQASAPEITGDRKVIRRKRDPLPEGIVEVIARKSVLSDFRRISDYKSLERTFELSNRDTATSEFKRTLLANAMLAYFSSAASCSSNALYNQHYYQSPQILSSLNATWPSATDIRFSTPNNSSTGKKSVFTVATERLPLESQADVTETLDTSLIKNLPARVKIEHASVSRTTEWQKTAAFTIAGIGAFGTFTSIYLGMLQNRMLLAATPILALLTYRGFAAFEVSQEQGIYTSHTKGLK